jgi:predicted phage-related endonuclease
VPALLAGRGFCLFVVPYNEPLADAISEAELDFWTSYVVPKIPPPDDYAPSIESLKRMKRQPGKVVPLEYAYVTRWQDASEQRKAAEKAEKEAMAAMLAKLGDAEAGECEGMGTLTYLEQTRKSYVSPESTYRVPRWKGAKK